MFAEKLVYADCLRVLDVAFVLRGCCSDALLGVDVVGVEDGSADCLHT